MKLLLIVDDYLPHSIKVAAKMMHELALEFKAKGHEVTVLTPSPGLKDKYKLQNIDGVNVLFFKSGEIKNISKVKRALNESLLSVRAWQSAGSYLKENKHDAIVYYSPSIFFGRLVGKLKKLWNAKSYLILRDIFPQWTVDNGLMKEGSAIHKYFKYFEQTNYHYADKIGVMSPANLNFFKSKGDDVSKFTVLFNWAKNGLISQPSNKYRKQLDLENKVVFFYGGNIGHAQNMMNLIRLAEQLKDDSRAHFVFVGKGDEVELILEEKEKNCLDNITYLPPVDQDTYVEMLNDFDIGMFSLHPDHRTHNFPGKLLGYMAYGKPIIGSVNAGNDLKGIVNDANAGFIFDNGEDELLYQAAKELIDSFELRERTGKKGKQLLSDQFSIEQACSHIVECLKS